MIYLCVHLIDLQNILNIARFATAMCKYIFPCSFSTLEKNVGRKIDCVLDTWIPWYWSLSFKKVATVELKLG